MNCNANANFSVPNKLSYIVIPDLVMYVVYKTIGTVLPNDVSTIFHDQTICMRHYGRNGTIRLTMCLSKCLFHCCNTYKFSPYQAEINVLSSDKLHPYPNVQ